MTVPTEREFDFQKRSCFIIWDIPITDNELRECTSEKKTVYTDYEDDDNINSVSGSHQYEPGKGQKNHKFFHIYYSSLY